MTIFARFIFAMNLTPSSRSAAVVAVRVDFWSSSVQRAELLSLNLLQLLALPLLPTPPSPIINLYFCKSHVHLPFPP